MNANQGPGYEASRVHAEDRAARVERQLATAQQITHLGSWEWDLASSNVSWSDELYRIYGLAPQSCEITLDFFLSRLHPDDRARVQRCVGEAIERGGRFAYPERIVRPDGSVRDLDTIGESVHDASGRAIALVGTCRDVTEERKRDATMRLFADIVDQVQIALSVWRVNDPDDFASIHLVAQNPAAERASGRRLADSVGRPMCELFPFAAGTELEALMMAVARDGATRDVLGYWVVEGGAKTRNYALKAFPLPGQCVGLAQEDTTRIACARELQAAEQRVLEMATSGAKLGDVLTTLVLAIEELSPPSLASILLMDADGRRVRHGAAPHLPDVYNRAIDGAEIGPTAGSCGTAAFERRQVIVRDVETDPLWTAYRHLVRPHGLRACWSTPIYASNGRVLGSFALYYREVRDPTPDDLELINRATHVAGLAIERHELDEQLRALSAHIEAVREDERTGIAREIHDELGQALTAMKMDLAWIARRASEPAGVPPDVLMDKLRSISSMIDDSIQQVRRISSELRPGVLDDLGLSSAIDWQAQEFENRTGTPVVVDTYLGDARIDRHLSTAVFRIFQEALTNIARHADATQVDVRVELSDGWLRLEVKDDGKGIGPEAMHSPRSLGLLGMRERAMRLGGKATTTANEGGGTVVRLEIPVPASPASPTSAGGGAS